ncbi:IS4 family transposase, partial [Vibrio vulnificus]
FQANTVRNRNVLSTVRLGMEALRRPDYEITTKYLLAAAMALAEQLLKDGYALADL